MIIFFISQLKQQSSRSVGRTFFWKNIRNSRKWEKENIIKSLFFCFLGFASSLLNYFSKTKMIFFKLGTRKFHFPKYKKNFFWDFSRVFSFYYFLYFFYIGLKSVQGIQYYCLGNWGVLVFKRELIDPVK